MENKFIITFAGAVGSSKTPIAHYLSWKLNLPVFSNDAIRTEMLEDSLVYDGKEYEKIRNSRLEEFMKSGVSFIYDASVDRKWSELKNNADVCGYSIFVISLDLSKDFLASLYKLKGYHETLARINELVADHDAFLVNYMNVVGVHIGEKEFKNRLELSYKAVKNWKK